MRHSRLIKPMINEVYPKAVKGKGIYVYDEEGNRYLDGCSGAVTVNLGHGAKEVIQAIHDQAQQLTFSYRSQFTNEAAEKLAQKLCEMTDGKYAWTFLVNSGSEATETAMKIAIQYWQEKGIPQKNKIISRWMSYHGITMGALSMSGHSERRERFATILSDTPSLEPPYCYRCPFNSSFPDCNLVCASQLETIIQRIGSNQIAGFIAEPIIGAAGAAITPPPGYYERIMEICKKHDILFIADEVMTGCGRTGKMLGIHHWDAEPDIICLGKGLGAGYTPIAAVLATDQLITQIAKGSGFIMSGHTFSANPLSAATALAVLNKLDHDHIIKSIAGKSAYFRGLLEQLKDESEWIGDIRGKGLLLGVEFVKNQKTKEPFPRSLNFTGKIINHAKRNGLLLYPASAGTDGRQGDALIIAPPLTITTQELDELYSIFRKSILEMKKIM